MGSAEPPWKNGWKNKKRKHAKKQFSMFMLYFESNQGRQVQRTALWWPHFFQIYRYFRMHHFVVKFSKFSSPQAARGRWPPNQNPADVPVVTITFSFFQVTANILQSSVITRLKDGGGSICYKFSKRSEFDEVLAIVQWLPFGSII